MVWLILLLEKKMPQELIELLKDIKKHAAMAVLAIFEKRMVSVFIDIV